MSINMKLKGGGTRSSNIELYRIIVMLSIVGHHYVVNSGLIQGPIAGNPTSLKSIFLLIFGMWGKTGINCFVLITGYFMCKNCITLKKLFKLLAEMYFYRIAIYLVFFVKGYEPVTLKRLVTLILPTTQIAQNFTGCYLVFFCLIPFLNILINSMDEKRHRWLVGILVCVFTVFGSVPKISIVFNYVTWYCILYLMSSYIRLYPNRFTEGRKWSGVLGIASIVLSIGSVVVLQFLRPGAAYFFVADSNKIFAVTTAVSSFCFFKNMKIKNSRIINAAGASTFGVLLIHANSDTMRNWLWRTFLNNVGAYESNIFFHAICSVFGIFVICVLIDQMRVKFIENPVMDAISRKWPVINKKIS